MAEVSLLWDIVENGAFMFPEKTAFLNRDGSSFTFNELRRHSMFVANELTLLGMYGKAAGIIGEVNYSALAALFGCARAGIAVVVLPAPLTSAEIEEFVLSYDIGCVFYSNKYKERCEALGEKLHGVYMFPEIEKLLGEAAVDVSDIPSVISAGDPAMMFFTSKEKKAVMLSHKNICASLKSIADNTDLSSYSFLTPQVWGGAFDCIVGLLLPLYCGCGLVKRGEKRSVAKAIYESGATALTCTSDRLVSLEKSLKIKSERQRTKQGIALSDFVGKILGSMGLKVVKRVHRKIHALMGDNLKLIICGGGYPDKADLLRFTSWGFKVLDCYFITELGTVAIGTSPNAALTPMEGVTIASPEDEKCEEIVILSDNMPFGYFGHEADFSMGFKTGDMGRVSSDGSLEVLGRKKTMLMCGRGEPIFPEEISAKLCRSRYISKCTVTGRFDTKHSDIVVSALIFPDYKEIASVMGEKYSENRLKLFLSKEIQKLSADLPHKINEFKLSERKSANTNEKK